MNFEWNLKNKREACTSKTLSFCLPLIAPIGNGLPFLHPVPLTPISCAIHHNFSHSPVKSLDYELTVRAGYYRVKFLLQ